MRDIKKRIGNPLDWSNVDKGIAFWLIFVISNIGALYLFVLARANPAILPLEFNPISDFILYFELASVILGIIIAALTLATRRSNPDGWWYVYSFFILSPSHDAVIFNWFGYLNFPFAMYFLFFYPFIAYLVFDFRVMITGLLAYLSGFVLFYVLELEGILPYAPGLNDPPFAENVVFGVFVIVEVVFLVGCTLYLCNILIRRWREREKQVTELTHFLKNMFGRYLSEEVMQSMLENPDSIKLGGEKRKITIMMTDLRGFTAISEKLQPEQVVSLLNSYLEAMMDIVKKHGGTVNDIIGDALLVTFGAPVEMKDHARVATAAAIEMQNAMGNLNEQNLRNGLPEIEMGVGLNTDEVIVGNIGTESRAKFAVIGSGVNMASRIEAYSVGGQVLASDALVREAGDVLRIDGSMQVHPKGADAPIDIYEIGGIGDPYNQALLKKDHELKALDRAVKVSFSVLEGKHGGKNLLEGAFKQLSFRGGEIICNNAELSEFDNLKLNLAGVDESLKRVSFYAKVLNDSDNGKGNYFVRFTAIPAEISAFFQATLLL